MLPHLGLSVCLYYWQIWRSAVAVARLALGSDSPFCQAHRGYHDHFCSVLWAVMAGVKDWLSTEQVIPSTWLLYSSSAKVNKYLHPLPIWRDLYTYFFPNVFLTNFVITLFPSSWPSSQSTGYSPWISDQLNIWLFLLPNNMYDHVCCLKFCPLWRFSFTSLSGLFQRGVML